MRRFCMLLVALVALVIFMAIPTLAADGETRTYCLCGDADGHVGTTINGCDGTVLTWEPWSSSSSTDKTLPINTGNYYLTESFTAGRQSTVAANNTVRLDLNGYTITRKDGRMYAAHNAGSTLCITDTSGAGTGTLKCVSTRTSNHYSGQGLVLRVASSSTLILINGTIDASEAILRNYYGGAVCTDHANSSFRMYGGTILGGVVYEHENTENRSIVGGALAVHTGIAEIFGGTISGGKAVSGGAVYCGSSATLKIHGGTISGGSIYSGSLTDTFSTPNNLAVYGNIEINGGTIEGYADLSEAQSITISGNPIIYAEDATFNLNIGSNTMVVNTMTAGANIHLTATGAPRALYSETVAAGTDSYFSSDSNEYGVTFDARDSKLWLGIAHCLCGSTSTNAADHLHYMDGNTLVGCDGSKIVWLPLATNITGFPTKTGNYYLTGNVNYSTQTGITTNNHIVLDLNGYKVQPKQTNGADANYRVISLHNAGAKFTLTDTYVVPDKDSADYDANRTGGEIICSKTRATKVDSGNTVGDIGCGVWLRSFNDNPTTFVMLGGKLTGADAVNPRSGSVVYADNYSKFYMLGGTITGGQSANSGGNLFVHSGAFVHISGGSINGGVAPTGGNVKIEGTTVITGGNIAGHADLSSAKSITISGNPIIYAQGATSNLNIGSKTMVVNAMTAGANIHLTATGAPRALSSATISAGADAYFHADVEGTGITRSNVDNKLWLGIAYCLCGSTSTNAADHVHYMDGAKCIGCDGTVLTWLPWTSTSSLPTKTGNFYLTAPVTLPSSASQQAPSAADTHIVLDLNGYAVNLATDRSIRIYAINKDNSTLTITDNYVVPEDNTDTTRTGGKMIRSNSYTGEGGVIWTQNSTQTFTLIRGELTAPENCAATGRGGLVSINGKFYMLGGNLHDGKTTGNGGNVTITTSGSMVMTGGTITGGQAIRGGNLCIEGNGQATILGGTISNGKAVGNGGGSGGNIYTYGSLTINGTNVSISGGKAGILDADGNVAYSEVVDGKTAARGWGGNINVAITGNKTQAGSLTLLSGTITGGESGANGGSIYTNIETSFTMEGGTISGGISHRDQGGNLFIGGDATISGSSRIENGIARNGGNIGINSTKTFTISGGTITGGKAGTYDATTQTVTITGNGGNIRTASTSATCELIISGSAQITNGSAKYGGNLSIERNADTAGSTVNFQIQGGTISGGSALNGGNIYIGGGISMSMTTGIVTKGTVLRDGSGTGVGGNMYLLSDASISGGTISNGQAGSAKTDTADAISGWAGNIEVGGGSTLTLSGTAQVLGGWANNNGGSIRVDKGTLLMQGGTISGGTTLDRGGNIFVSSQQTLTITGGSISDGHGNGCGNIACNEAAIISLSNVTISGGISTSPSSADRSSMEISKQSTVTFGDGTTITGNIELVETQASTTLSGKVFIGGESGKLHLGTNLLTLDGITTDSQVYFKCSDKEEGRIVTNAVNLADIPSASALVSDDGYRIALNTDNKLYLTNLAVAGATLNGSDVVIPLNTAVQLASDATSWVQLVSNHEGALTLTKNLNLDLNGYKLTGDITIADGSTLYLADTGNENFTDKGGRITGQITGGNVAQVFLTGNWEGYGHNYRYVVVKDKDTNAYHAHRIYLAVKTMVLHPNSSAINFRTVLRCDDTFKGYITAYGATAKAIVDGENPHRILRLRFGGSGADRQRR